VKLKFIFLSSIQQQYLRSEEEAKSTQKIKKRGQKTLEKEKQTEQRAPTPKNNQMKRK